MDDAANGIDDPDVTPSDDDAAEDEPRDGVDLRGILRQLTAPMIESLDSRLKDQVEAHVDELLAAKVDAAVAARLATIDAAIAHLTSQLDAVERRVAAIETADEVDA